MLKFPAMCHCEATTGCEGGARPSCSPGAIFAASGASAGLAINCRLFCSPDHQLSCLWVLHCIV